MFAVVYLPDIWELPQPNTVVVLAGAGGAAETRTMVAEITLEADRETIISSDAPIRIAPTANVTVSSYMDGMGFGPEEIVMAWESVDERGVFDGTEMERGAWRPPPRLEGRLWSAEILLNADAGTRRRAIIVVFTAPFMRSPEQQVTLEGA